MRQYATFFVVFSLLLFSHTNAMDGVKQKDASPKLPTEVLNYSVPFLIHSNPDFKKMVKWYLQKTQQDYKWYSSSSEIQNSMLANFFGNICGELESKPNMNLDKIYEQKKMIYHDEHRNVSAEIFVCDKKIEIRFDNNHLCITFPSSVCDSHCVTKLVRHAWSHYEMRLTCEYFYMTEKQGHQIECSGHEKIFDIEKLIKTMIWFEFECTFDELLMLYHGYYAEQQKEIQKKHLFFGCQCTLF
jgi:hypothetical protein